MSAKTTHPLLATETTGLLLSGSQLPRFVADRVNPSRGRRGSQRSASPEQSPTTFFSCVQQALGFLSRRNAKLFLALVTSLVLFIIITLKYLPPTAPEVGLLKQSLHRLSEGYPKFGLLLHLACALPAGLLAPFQFIQKIRYAALWLHRVNGYLTMTLMLFAIVSEIFIARCSYGGGLSMQLALYTLALIVSSSLIFGISSIRNARVDAHRRWMLRAWAYASVIIALKTILFLGVALFGWRANTYSTAFRLQNDAAHATAFPSGQLDSPEDPRVNNMYISIPESLQDALGRDMSGGPTVTMAAWLAIFIHGVCVEVYLALTQGENGRLKRQLTSR